MMICFACPDSFPKTHTLQASHPALIRLLGILVMSHQHPLTFCLAHLPCSHVLPSKAHNSNVLLAWLLFVLHRREQCQGISPLLTLPGVFNKLGTSSPTPSVYTFVRPGRGANESELTSSPHLSYPARSCDNPCFTPCSPQTSL